MPHTLQRQAMDHLVGDQLIVGGCLDAFAHGLKRHQEANEIFVDVQRLCGVECQRGSVIALRQLHQRLRHNGAFQVQVQLTFRQRTQPVAIDFSMQA